MEILPKKVHRFGICLKIMGQNQNVMLISGLSRESGKERNSQNRVPLKCRIENFK